MTKQMTKLILLVSVVAIAVSASIYLSREQRRLRTEAPQPGTPGSNGSTGPADADPVRTESARSRSRELRQVIHGAAGDLAHARDG